MAEATEQGVPVRGPRSGWVPLGAAAGVVVLLGAGWPLLGAATPSTQALEPGYTVEMGSGGGYAASLELPQNGWHLETTRTAADQRHVLLRGPVGLDLASIRPPPGVEATPENLWAGLGATSRVGDGSARLGSPESTTSQDGTEGLVGDLHTQGRTELAAVFASPDGRFAVTLRLGGQDATEADLDAVEDVVRAVAFEREEGSS